MDALQNGPVVGGAGGRYLLLLKQAPSPRVSLYYGLLPTDLRNCGSQCQSLVKRKGTI